MRFLIWTTFIGQIVYPLGGKGIGVKLWMWGIVINASWNDYFIRVYENLVQHPSIYISIIIRVPCKRCFIQIKSSFFFYEVQRLFLPREGRYNGLLITLVPKVLLFVNATTLRTLVDFYWLVN